MGEAVEEDGIVYCGEEAHACPTCGTAGAITKPQACVHETTGPETVYKCVEHGWQGTIFESPLPT